MVARFILFVVVFNVVTGCTLFGRTTVTHDRFPMFTIPEPPNVQPDNGTIERWQENFSQVATWAIRYHKSVLTYNEIALKHNVEFGFITPEEVDEIRRVYGMPKPPDGDEQKEPASSGEVKSPGH